MLGRWGVSDQQLGSGVAENVGAALAGIVRVDRQVSSTGFGDRQQRNHQPSRAGQGHRDNGFRPCPTSGQTAGQIGCPNIEFAVGQRLLIILDRRRLGNASNLRAKQFRDSGFGDSGGVVIALDQKPLTFDRIDDLDQIDPSLRFGANCTQK